MIIKKMLLVFFTAFACTAMAQTKNDYLPHWKKVEDFEKKGLAKSALTEVMVIYNLAVKDNNDAQQIKSSMYQIKYRNMVDEDSREKNIFYIDTLIAKAKAPAKNILQSMQAEMYWQYLQNNRYKFYDRTTVKEEKSKDIGTWSIDKIYSVISRTYKASLNNESLLKATGLNDFDAVIIKGTNTTQLRPTLYDFLAHRALNYFMADENPLIKPTYEFKINDPKAFAPVHEFVNASFKTKDTASLQHKALLLLQDILKFHIADAKPDASIDADLIRLNFVNQYSVIEDKENLYEASLKDIETRFANNPLSAQAAYLRADIYFNRGQQFDAITKPANQFEIKKAKELCEATIKKFPKSEGGINCQNLITTIIHPSLKLETEKVNTINDPFRSLVTYKNAAKIYLRIIKTSHDEMRKIGLSDYDKLWKNYTALKPFKSWSVSLPDQQDYQQHSTEIKIDGLDNGVYMILASIDEKFSLTKNIITSQVIHVSNISYINNGNEYYVLDRNNGQPLTNTQVQVWERKYNYQISKDDEIKVEKYTTDKNGNFKMKAGKDYRNFLLQFKTNTDELFMSDNEGFYVYNGYESTVIKPQTFLFTDRSIYRPGQTVYFKGIVVKAEKDAGKTAIVPGFKTNIILRNANKQKAAELSMTSNDFGSYNGSFKLPEGILNGEFTLYDSLGNGVQSFNVEEYKRPKFFVTVEKPKGTYRLNDSIKVTGNAKAYAGNNIDGAKVKYRVIRRVQYPIWWDWGFYGRGKIAPYSRQQTEISNGELVTDVKGAFNITFKALPDESVDKKTQPTFFYEVYTDITDINGETRSGSTSVAVAYQMLQLNIDMPEKINADSLKYLKISSTNLNDIFEKANVNVTITKLIAPNKIYRERYWDMPDQFIMSKKEYETYFPYDVYKDEDQMNKWPLGNKVVETADTTAENSKFKIQNKGFEAGWYKIVATTKDKYGEEVKAEKYVQVMSGGQQTKDNSQPIVVDVKRSIAEPGEKIEYNIATGFDNIWLIHSISKMDKTVNTTYQTITNKQSLSSVQSVAETDRGGMAMDYAFVQHNRIYSGSEKFEIPWSNKELNITYSTLRDKLLPGANEKWTVHISGRKGEKVATEMVAAMYDASLDQFKPHNWNRLYLWPSLYDNISWKGKDFEKEESVQYDRPEAVYVDPFKKAYAMLGTHRTNKDIEIFEWSGGDGEYYNYDFNAPEARILSTRLGLVGSYKLNGNISYGYTTSNYDGDTQGRHVKIPKMECPDADGDGVCDNLDREPNTPAGSKVDASGVSVDAKAPTENIKVRKNFNETAFFFPELRTDAEGNISFEFTIPEALTSWKLMTLAHTKDLASGYKEGTTVTQKPLMVQPNAPRFLREGDKMEFSAKIVNLGDSEVTGTAQLELLDAATNKPVDGWFKNVFPTQYFTVAAGQSFAVKFPMEVPFNFNSSLLYRIKAVTQASPLGGSLVGAASDGEEMALPVLTNRALVTETMPINLRNQTSKTFKFDKLLNSGSGTTLSNHALTVEYSSNPAWYAVQALPYLMEFPYECAEQTFNRYYANALASYVSNSTAKIKAVFEKWKTLDTAALQSNLEKNPELKSALLEETPWVMDAKNESQQKKNIALLFDMIKMSSQMDIAFDKLNEMQSSNGGFVWFKGGPDDRYITQYIITGIGHLRKLNALNADNYQKLKTLVDKAVVYLDKKIKEDYDNLIRYKTKLSNDNLSDIQIQYLYMRSFFPEYKIADASLTAYNYYRGQSQKFWLSSSKYMQATIALALYRSKDEITAKAITRSLKENAIVNEEMGMYWKEWTNGGYYWQQAPIESQAMMIEAFSDIDKNNTTVDDLKTWLLKQKQTQNWKTTKATAEACYALLLNGSNWLSEEKEVTINLGSTVIKSTDNATEAGTGYFKKRIDGEKVKPEMGNISVSIKSSETKSPPSGGWGAVYWQYFEDLDKITSSETPLKLKKQLFIERNTGKGPVLEALADGAELKVGDKVKVRIELKVDRDMEYVHMKDMRAACMEPVNVISEYKYQGGLGYYESTKDASTNFFFGSLNRGTYVFEYPLFVTHTGNFSNGITSIQCMYAPEFSSHSEGIRINVE
jgi:uncharacterized protein YfaS (alpha-2-macroglobulin family)